MPSEDYTPPRPPISEENPLRLSGPQIVFMGGQMAFAPAVDIVDYGADRAIKVRRAEGEPVWVDQQGSLLPDPPAVE